MIDQLVNQAAAAMLNRMLAREAWARDKLVPFAGRAARIEALPFTLLLKIADDGTMVAHDTGEPSVTIGLSLSSLPLALLEPSRALQDVRLVGDAEFAQALSFVLQNLRPEPEEELSRFIGDAAAVRLVAMLRTSASHWRQLAERMLENTAHYVVAENPMVIGRDEAAEFASEVNRLRDDVERLEKRFDLLART
jgi:ubiquinone biosynthesis accessory factor UbiJ